MPLEKITAMGPNPRIMYKLWNVNPIHYVPSWSWFHGNWIYNYLCNQCILPLTLWVRIPLMARWTRYNIMCLSLSVISAGRWFSPSTPISSTNETDRHYIAEVFLNMVWKIITIILTIHWCCWNIAICECRRVLSAYRRCLLQGEGQCKQ